MMKIVFNMIWRSGKVTLHSVINAKVVKVCSFINLNWFTFSTTHIGRPCVWTEDVLTPTIKHRSQHSYFINLDSPTYLTSTIYKQHLSVITKHTPLVAHRAHTEHWQASYQESPCPHRTTWPSRNTGKYLRRHTWKLNTKHPASDMNFGLFVVFSTSDLIEVQVFWFTSLTYTTTM